MKRASIAVSLLLALFAVSLFAQETPRAMEIDDTFGFKRVGSPVISPDGNYVLYTVTENDWKSNGRLTHIWRVGIDGTGAVQMTRGDKSCSSPVWSSCSRAILFTSGRSGEGQVWMMLNGGGEAWQITEHATSAGQPAWPAGKVIYFLAEDEKTEADKAREEAENQVVVVDKNLKNVHLWSYDLQEKTERKITNGDFSIRDYVFSPDEQKIAFIAAPTPKVDDNLKIEVYLLTLESGEVVRLTDNRITEYDLSWKPDGSALTFTSDANENLETYYQSSIFLLPLDGSAPKDLLPGYQEEVFGSDWIDDGTILFAANTGVNVHIFTLDVASGEVKQITEGEKCYIPSLLQREKGLLAGILTDPYTPADVYLFDIATGEAKRLTDTNPQIKDFKLAQYRTIHWTAPDGYEAEGLLILPPDYEEGKSYPMIAQLHGGPESSDKNMFSTSWATYPHVLAGKGYVLFQPNYRASTGYGDDVMRAIIGRYFEDDIADIISGIDYLVEQGIADPDKLGCHGWSAGGHLTNWLVTHYSDRFKAAASGAGGANWASFYAQTDMHYIREIWFTAPPYEKPDLFRDKSPISYIRDASTPTIIFCGASDNRVPAPQSWEMYVGLQRYGVESEFRLYPGEPHGLTKLSHQKDKMTSELAWFDKFILGKEPVVEQPAEPEK